MGIRYALKAADYTQSQELRILLLNAKCINFCHTIFSAKHLVLLQSTIACRLPSIPCRGSFSPVFSPQPCALCFALLSVLCCASCLDCRLSVGPSAFASGRAVIIVTHSLTLVLPQYLRAAVLRIILPIFSIRLNVKFLNFPPILATLHSIFSRL